MNHYQGKEFEHVFKKICLYSGLFCIRNYHSAQIVPGSRPRLIPGQLDFTVVDKNGVVGFFDTKTFQGDRFGYSRICEHQLRRAADFNRWGVPSGFVVWFMAADRIRFFSGQQIFSAGSGSGFGPLDGLDLGTITTLQPAAIMRPPNRRVSGPIPGI